MKQFFIIPFLLFFLSGCTTFKANLKDAKYEKFDLITGQPVWEVEKSSKKKYYIAPLAGGAAGYYFSREQRVNLGGKTLSASESSGVYILGGLLAGAGVNLLIKSMSPKSKEYKIQDQNEWLRSYSEQKRDNFVFPDLSRNTQYNVSIMKATNHEKYLNSYLSYMDIMTNGKADFSTFKDARGKIDKEFTVFSKEKRLNLQNSIDKAELSHARNHLQREFYMVETRAGGFERIDKLNGFINANQYAFTILPGDEKREYTDKIASEIAKDMEGIVSQRRSSLSSIPKTLNSIEKINLLFVEYKKDIAVFGKYYDSSKYYNELSKLKTEIIAANSNQISSLMANGQSIAEITSIEEKYLANTVQSNASVSLLHTVSEGYQKSMLIGLEAKRLRALAEAQKRESIMMNETTVTGEPTEAQMKYAVRRAYLAGRNQLESIKYLPQDDNNTITKLASLFAGIQSSVNVEITKLKKLGCSPAVNRPGFVCDYITDFEFDSSNQIGKFITDSYGSLYKAMNNQAVTGRFLKVDGEWRLIEIIE